MNGIGVLRNWMRVGATLAEIGVLGDAELLFVV